MEERLNFNCWNCKREYSLFLSLEPDEQPMLVVTCPFCGAQGVTDLAKIRTPVEAVAKSLEDILRGTDKPVAYRYDFSRVLQTAEPDNNDS